MLREAILPVRPILEYGDLEKPIARANQSGSPLALHWSGRRPAALKEIELDAVADQKGRAGVLPTPARQLIND